MCVKFKNACVCAREFCMFQLAIPPMFGVCVCVCVCVCPNVFGGSSEQYAECW